MNRNPGLARSASLVPHCHSSPVSVSLRSFDEIPSPYGGGQGGGLEIRHFPAGDAHELLRCDGEDVAWRPGRGPHDVVLEKIAIDEGRDGRRETDWRHAPDRITGRLTDRVGIGLADF